LPSAPPVDTDVPSHVGCVAALRAVTCAGRPACYRLAHGRSTGVPGRSSLPGSCVTWHRKTTLLLGWALDQVQYKGYSTTHAQHITHTHRHLRAAQWAIKWPQRCGLLIVSLPYRTDRQNIRTGHTRSDHCCGRHLGF